MWQRSSSRNAGHVLGGVRVCGTTPSWTPSATLRSASTSTQHPSMPYRPFSQSATFPLYHKVPRSATVHGTLFTSGRWTLSNRAHYATSPYGNKLRNVAIIAHVDHGKTSLVDKLLTQSGTLEAAEGERVMDSNELEKERGITILAKQTSLDYEGHHINIVDTPGHGDFGGEVERIMTMVDGVVLLVDATEGPMTQTKFVLSKALQHGLRPIVVLNKMDRNTTRVDEVETELFDLFSALNATEEQLSYPTLYASAREGWCIKNLRDSKDSMNPLFDAIIAHVPPPRVEEGAPFKLLVTNLEHDHHLGRILVGRVHSGSVKPGDELRALSREGKELESGKVIKVLGRKGMDRYIMSEGFAGDIVGVAGFSSASVTDTLAHPTVATPVPANPIDPPVLSMMFGINNSPLAGKEGSKLTSGMLRDRLHREIEHNVTLEVKPTGSEGQWEVRGRGELQLSILIENMRREGFELSISPPEVLSKTNSDGKLLEPMEEVFIEIPNEYVGLIIDKMSARRGEVAEMKQTDDRTTITFHVPSRTLIGFRSEVNMVTRGTMVMHHTFHSWVAHKGEIENSRKGVLVSTSDGIATTHALHALEPRGVMFVSPQAKVYTGMIVGEHTKKGDLDVNPVKEKHLTNMRSMSKEEFFRLMPPRNFSLEEALTYVNDEELVEVTPQSIRMRKALLDPNARATALRKKKK